MYCMHCLIFKRNVFRNQRKCNTQKIQCLWCKNGIYFTREIGFLNICTHENINKFLSHLWNKFHIRQTNDDLYTQLQRNIFECIKKKTLETWINLQIYRGFFDFLILHFCRIYDWHVYQERKPTKSFMNLLYKFCMLVGWNDLIFTPIIHEIYFSFTQEEDQSLAPTTTDGGSYQFNAAATIPQQGFSFWWGEFLLWY